MTGLRCAGRFDGNGHCRRLATLNRPRIVGAAAPNLAAAPAA